MKKIMSLIIVCILVFSLAACSNGKSNVSDSSVDTVEKADKDTEEIEVDSSIVNEEEEEEPVDYESVYSIILDRYYDSVSQELDPQGLTNAGICYLCALNYGDDPLGNIGYAYKDVTGNGIPELIIGAVNDGRTLFELYTIVDNAVVSVLASAERNAYFLCSDGTIANTGSSSAALSAFNYYTIDGANLVFKEGILYDGMANEENPWFKANIDDYYSANDEPITEAEATAVIDSYEALYTTVELTPFANYR